MNLPLHDAHNHLHDARLDGHRGEILAQLPGLGLVNAVVNGTCEEDWVAVEKLAGAHTWILPSYGLHPWQVKTRSRDWQQRLAGHLDRAATRVGVGEIGLDKWIRDYDLEEQRTVFAWQLRLAAERNLPASIHCLQAWGSLADVLDHEPVPARGFLLHAYGGPAEIVNRLARRGAYFSFNGHFLHERKHARREIFRSIPLERLLVETDAPDMCLPDEAAAWKLPDDPEGRPVNHPGNISIIYQALARLRHPDLPVGEAGRAGRKMRPTGAVWS